MDLFKQLFLIKPVKRINIKKKSFSPKSEPHTDKLGLCVVLKHFLEIHIELFFLDIKVTISETSTEILRNLFFLLYLKGTNPEENLDLFKQVFLIKPVKRDKY